MENTKIEKVEKVKNEREPKNFWKKFKKNPLFLASICANLVFVLILGLGLPFGIYPYLAKKFLNYGQQSTLDIVKKLYKKNLGKVEYDVIDSNDTMARVLFNKRTQEKYGIKVLSDWELDQDDVKQAIRSAATNQVKRDSIQKWISMNPSWPVLGKFTSRIGFRLDPLAKAVGGDPTVGNHQGLDISVPSGNKVTPFLPGVVSEIGNQGEEGMGKYVKVNHGDGLVSYYGHLSTIKAVKGQQVLREDVIGLSGNTGRSTGDHLHFQINLNNKPIDPEEFFKKRM